MIINKAALWLGLILLTGCLREEAKMEPAHKGLATYLGFKVSIKGRVSDMPWQHLIWMEKSHPYIYYIDWEDGQTVVYSAHPLECGPGVLVTGTVILSEGVSKKPGSEQAYAEYQIMADTIECVQD